MKPVQNYPRWVVRFNLKFPMPMKPHWAHTALCRRVLDPRGQENICSLSPKQASAALVGLLRSVPATLQAKSEWSWVCGSGHRNGVGYWQSHYLSSLSASPIPPSPQPSLSNYWLLWQPICGWCMGTPQLHWMAVCKSLLPWRVYSDLCKITTKHTVPSEHVLQRPSKIGP